MSAARGPVLKPEQLFAFVPPAARQKKCQKILLPVDTWAMIAYIKRVNQRQKEEVMDKPYKHNEVEEHFAEWLSDQDQEWIENNLDDLHHHCFNTDYFIIGTHQAKEWLGDKVFEVIEIIKEYEQSNFGEVSTDLSDPEKIVNMYTYIVGEEIVGKFRDLQEAA